MLRYSGDNRRKLNNNVSLQRGIAVVAARRIATLFAVCCCLGGCASRSIYFDSLPPVPPNDSSRSSITDVSSGVRGGVSLPHRDLIRVDLTLGHRSSRYGGAR
jgi:hypothetical protein